MKTLLPLLLLLTVPGFAQEPPRPAPETATIYIYKGWHVATLWRAAFAVYMNEKMIARLDRGIFLIAKVPPGQYEFRTKNRKAGGVRLDVKAGDVYHLKLETDSGMQVTNPHLSLVPEQQWSFDMKQMKPIEAKDVKDKSVVMVDYTKFKTDTKP